MRSIFRGLRFTAREHHGPIQPLLSCVPGVTGIGFLGAGAILLSEGRIKGLTTASSIWVASALGMAIGLGEFWLAGAAAILVFVIHWLFVPFDRMIDLLGREIREYDIIYLARENKTEEVERLIKGHQLKILRKRKMKSEDRLIGEYEVRGMHKNHNQLVERLLEDKEIYEVREVLKRVTFET